MGGGSWDASMMTGCSRRSLNAKYFPFPVLFSVLLDFRLRSRFTSNTVSLPQAPSCTPPPGMEGADATAGLRCAAPQVAFPSCGWTTQGLQWNGTLELYKSASPTSLLRGLPGASVYSVSSLRPLGTHRVSLHWRPQCFSVWRAQWERRHLWTCPELHLHCFLMSRVCRFSLLIAEVNFLGNKSYLSYFIFPAELCTLTNSGFTGLSRGAWMERNQQPEETTAWGGTHFNNQHLRAGGQAGERTERPLRKDQIPPSDSCLKMFTSTLTSLSNTKKLMRHQPVTIWLIPALLGDTSLKSFSLHPHPFWSLSCSESAQHLREEFWRPYTRSKLAPQFQHLNPPRISVLVP